MKMSIKAKEQERHVFIMIIPTVLQLRQILDSKTYYSSARKNWIRGDYIFFCRKKHQNVELLGYGIIEKIQNWLEKDNWTLPYGHRHLDNDCISLKYVNILKNPLSLDYLHEKFGVNRFKQAMELGEDLLDDVLEILD